LIYRTDAFSLLSKSPQGMAAMAARAIWKGSIYFGLVNIPIQAFSVQQRSLQENMKSTSAVAKTKRKMDMAVNK
jgi:non-homologous end joining protein Ku